MDFMFQRKSFRLNLTNEFGTALIMPYEDEDYSFFYLLPAESSNLEQMRSGLTGESLLDVLNKSKETSADITVPKFKIESQLDGVEVLSQLGVNCLFKRADADLSKISNTRFVVSKIQHSVIIETDEMGTVAAASTVVQFLFGSSRFARPSIVINRPFLFGILRNDVLLFIGQFA